MARLRGVGHGSGIALGVAAVVRVHSGIPLSPEPPASIVRLKASGRYSETPSVTLVAEDFLPALAIAGTIRWGEVVGIVAQNPFDSPPPSALLAVTGISRLLERVEDDMLILLDASQGVVLIDPDPIEIALYQAEHERIAPKKRIFLEAGHLPARTADGREILVLAQTQTTEDLELALEAGADGLLTTPSETSGGGFFFPSAEPLLPASGEEDAMRRALLRLAETAKGKPVFLAKGYEMPLAGLLEASQRAAITLLLSPMTHLAGWGLEEFQEALAETETLCLQNAIPCAMPQIGAETHAKTLKEQSEEALGRWAEALATHGATRLLVKWNADRSLEEAIGWLESLCVACGANGLPVFVEMPAPPQTPEGDLFLRALAGVGAAGVCVTPEDVSETKRALRLIHAGDCREAVLKFLQGGKFDADRSFGGSNAE